jgi:hypothetical protein
MTPLTFCLVFLGLWSSIHLIHRFYPTAHRSRDILPTSLSTRQRKSTTVTLAGPYLRIESTAFNASHDTLVQWFCRNRNARARTMLRVVFDSGIVISLLGMMVALALLAWTFVQLAHRSVAGLVLQSTDIYPHAKRAFDDNYVPPTLAARAAPDIPVQLLVCASHSIWSLPSCLWPVFATTRSRIHSDPRNHPSALTFPSTHMRAVLFASYT